MNVISDLDRTEALLWTILSRFESLAVAQYAVTVPTLLTPEKDAVIALLRTRVHGDDELNGTQLEAPIAALMHSVTSSSEARVLIGQGLFLELIGEAIYATFGANEATSEPTRALCQRGSAASRRARELVPGLLRARIGQGDVLLQAIMNESAPLLRSLDDLGEGIDATFLERFGVSFADLMGDVAAELIAICLELDVDRRKFVSFLTSALMGI
jgi:class 3 adenylate cyclase